MLRPLTVLGVLVALSGCATTTTQLAPVAPERIEQEEQRQRELVVTELQRAQARLDSIAHPLLASALPLCPDDQGRRHGFRFDALNAYESGWRDAARTALGLSDTLTVTAVTPESPARRAGLLPRDRLLSAGGIQFGLDKSAPARLGEALALHGSEEPVALVVARDGESLTLNVIPEPACDYGLQVIVEGDINAFADGENIIVPWAMMRFANDDELRVIVAHEIAHNAMGHIDAKKKNAAVAGFFGLLADVALASQGVNTGGQYTADFMKLGAIAYSQDFEREADYVGMYILARAGVDLATAPSLWRHFAQINPSAIGYAGSHPTTAERFVRLDQTVEEIRAKQEAGLELLPSMKETGR